MPIYVPEYIQVDYECPHCGDMGVMEVYLTPMAHYETYGIFTEGSKCPACGKDLEGEDE